MAIALLLATNLCSQRIINETYDASDVDVIMLSFDYGNVKLISWDKDEVSITGTVDVNMGEANDAFKILYMKRDNRLMTRAVLEKESDIPSMIVMSKGGKKSYKKVNEDKSKWREWKDAPKDEESYDYFKTGLFTQMEFEVKIPKGMEVKIKCEEGNIDLKDVTADLDILSVNGKVNAIYTKPPQQDMRLRSKHDLVDLSLPPNANLDIEVAAVNGDILTDFEFDLDNYANKTTNKNQFMTTLNKGGSKLLLKSDKHNVYLRKGK